MLRLPYALPAAFALLAAATLACSGDSKPRASNTDPGEVVIATGTPVTDEAYLAVFCTGATHYQEAVNTERTKEGLARAVQDYSSEMAKLVPPEDLRAFHGSFIKYLNDAVSEPTTLLTKAPPLPPESVRSRLAGKTSNVPECKYPTFLSISKGQ